MSNYELKKRWENLAGTSKLSLEIYEKLKKKYSNYSDEWRCYHNLDHLSQMFKDLDKHFPKLSKDPAIQYAIFFHDYFSNGTLMQTAEYRSASFAKKSLQKLKVEKNTINKVFLIIWSSNKCPSTWTIEDKVFNDLDYKVLASSSLDYLLYVIKIFDEKTHHTNSSFKHFFLRRVFIKRRREFLKKLQNKKIFFTGELLKLNDIAQENILIELRLGPEFYPNHYTILSRNELPLYDNKIDAKLEISRDLKKRQTVWDEMQMLYMDTEPHPIKIANVCAESNYSIESLESIFLYEIFPSLRFNVLTIPGGEWTGFEISWLTQRILNKNSYGKFCKPIFLRSHYRNIWSTISLLIEYIRDTEKNSQNKG